MIPFNLPPVTGDEESFIQQSLVSSKMSGDGPFSQKCHQWFQENLNRQKVLLTTSCTHSLEMAALLIDIQLNDEVIMPSYTFVSTANAFALRGAKIVFVDIRADTKNIDEEKIEAAITARTKAIVAVHYAGVVCEMNRIMEIATLHDLVVVEDAAQAMMSLYDGKPAGTIGHIGAYSFHETKNYTSGGEGGLLIVNDSDLADRAEIIREKGTNRSQFFRGAVDKYTWVDIGSSYLLNDLSAAYLWGQLINAEVINNRRIELFNRYVEAFLNLENEGHLELPNIPDKCISNGHMFYFLLASLSERTQFIEFLGSKGIMSVFHYVPLHSSPAGLRLGEFSGDDVYTSEISNRLVRLPLFYNMTNDQQSEVIDAVHEFFTLGKINEKE